MKLHNIRAIVRNDLNVLRRVTWRWLEMTLFPITTLIIWGLFARYSAQYAAEAGLLVLVGNLFWSFSHLAQQEANMLIMEDLWTLNIRHVLISGITEYEYIIAKLLLSTSIAVSIGAILFGIAVFFGAPLLTNVGTVLALFLIALLGSLALAVIISGVVMMMGREYAFLSWSSLHFLVFFSAPFFSPSVFPLPLQWLSEIMPFTYVFEGARALATGAPVPASLLLHALAIAAVYFVLSWPWYWFAFRQSRKSGVLARVAH